MTKTTLVHFFTARQERPASCESTLTPCVCSSTISKNLKPTGASCSTRWMSGWSAVLSWGGSTTLIWLECSNWLAFKATNRTTLMIKIQLYARAKQRYKKKTKKINCWTENFVKTPSAGCRTTSPDYITLDCKLGSRNGSRLLLTWSIESYSSGNLLSSGGITGFTTWKPLSKTGFIELNAMRPKLRSAKQKLLGTNSSTQTHSNSNSILTIRRNWNKRLPSRMLRQAYTVLGLSISFLL